MKIAVIDLYGADENFGIPSIETIINDFSTTDIDYTIFPVRLNNKWPQITDFDGFISSGGPGNPTVNDGPWYPEWKAFMQRIMEHNSLQSLPPKPVFLICFSFQLFCHHFNIGIASARGKKSIGPYLCYPTLSGKYDPIFGQLDDPFWIMDFRSYQITNLNETVLDEMSGQLLALEVPRPHIPKERALMGIRIADHIVGTQFHPEISGKDSKEHFLQPKEKESIIGEFGEGKYKTILSRLEDPSEIEKTRQALIPGFLQQVARIKNG